MSIELSLFILVGVYIALAFGLGYVVGVNRTLKAARSRLPRRPSGNGHNASETWGV